MTSKSEMIRRGLKKGFETGTSKMIDRVCYGYSKDKNGGLVINESEAKTVQSMFKWYLSGDSLGKIANKLFDMGIPSPTRKPKWNREAIDKLLSNEKYTGQVMLQKTVSFCGIQIENNNIEDKYLVHNNHQAIISQDVFDEVQAEKLSRAKSVQFSQSML